MAGVKEVRTDGAIHVETLTGVVVKKGFSPYIDPETNTWWEYDPKIKKYTNTGIKAGIEHSWDGTWLKITSGSGTSAANLQGPKGDKGDPFTYKDFTQKQLAALQGKKGDKGDPFKFSDFTEQELQLLKGEKGDLGEKGEPFTYEDFTPEQLDGLRGDKGETGDVYMCSFKVVNGRLMMYHNNDRDKVQFYRKGSRLKMRFV